MPRQERVQKETSHTIREKAAEEITPVKEIDTEALKTEMDNILDEIDSVLETNAQEFVANYIQKGGE